MIIDNIHQSIAEALKSKDKTRLSTLRMLLSAINYEKIEKGRELTQEEEYSIVRKEAKKRRDAMEAYQKGSRKDLYENEKNELSILYKFLPPEVSDEELDSQIQKELVNFPKADTSQIGQIMGILVPKLKGKASPARIGERLKKVL